MKNEYLPNNTALIIIDPYNDFISDGGKLWPLVKNVIEATGTIKNMLNILTTARKRGIKVFYVPHHRWEPGDFMDWKYPTPYQLQSAEFRTFEKDTWGSEFHPDFAPQKGDIIVKEHWSASGFANTDLDLKLTQHGIEKLIVIGLLANSCAESTAKYGAELGYHVTLVKDATAAFTAEAMHAAHEINGPMYAHALYKTDELLSQI